MNSILYPKKDNALKKLFNTEKAIIGVIHCLPTPGSPQFEGESMDKSIEYAITEAQKYSSGGVDGVIVENAWDIPFSKPENIGIETVAAMSVLADRVKQNIDIPVGVNCLANGVLQSLAAAKASNTNFIRANQWVNAYIANEGFIEGAASKATRYRNHIGGKDIIIMADVHVKHGSHSIVGDRSLFEQARDAEWFAADILIATGNRTGDSTSLEEIKKIKEATTLPVIIGSGLNFNNANELLQISDGAIVGTSLKKDSVWWSSVEEDKVKKLMEITYSLRKK